MAAFDFPPNAVDPNPPEVGDTYKPPGSDITYQWNGTVWNASVGQSTVGVTLVTGGDGIDTSPVAGITETGNVAVDSTVVRTTGAQIINGNKTFPDGIYGNTFGGTSTYTSLADGSGTQLGSITAINDTKLTIATTAGAFGTQLVTPDDQYVEVVSGATAYARFNAADTSLRIGGTLATAPNITLNADGRGEFANTVTSPSFYGSGTGTSQVWYGGTTGTSKITADGSAEFANYVAVPNSSATNRSALTTLGVSSVRDTIDQSKKVWSGFGGTTETSTINSDGSASFAGSVQSLSWPTTGYQLEGSGALGLNAAGGTTGNMVSLNVGGTSVASITGSGSAIFNDSVAIGGTYKGTFNADNLDGQRSYQLPNADGTIALTSNISGGAIEFIGDIDVVNDTAPTTPTSAIWVNTQAGNANASFTGLNQQYIALNQLIFLTDNNGWVPGGVTDPATYVTIATNQTISGTKSFDGTVKQGTFNGGQTTANGSVFIDGGGVMTQFEASTTAADNRAFVVYHGSNEQIEFKGDGSASFAGAISSTATNQAFNATANLITGGSFFWARNNVAASDRYYLYGDVDGDSTPKVKLATDGSATFAGRVFSADLVAGSTDYTGPYFYAGPDEIALNTSQSTSVFKVETDGYLDCVGLTDGTTTKTMTEVLNPPPSVPSGSVFYFAAATAPSGYLQCDGSAVSRTTYADLFAICSTTFGAGDGTSTFNLPDLRGEFIRGFDGGRDVDSGRAFGSTQDSAVDPGDIQVNDPGHSHGASGSGQYPLWATGPAKVTPAPTGQGYRQGSGINVTVNPANTGITIGNPASDADETRPRNVALLPCIKT